MLRGRSWHEGVDTSPCPPPPPPRAQHVLDRAQSVSVSDICNVLLAFARLNFRPEQEDSFFSLVCSAQARPPPCGWEGGRLAGAGRRARWSRPPRGPWGVGGAALETPALHVPEAFSEGSLPVAALTPETPARRQGPVGHPRSRPAASLGPSRGRAPRPVLERRFVPTLGQGGLRGKARWPNVLLSRWS